MLRGTEWTVGWTFHYAFWQHGVMLEARSTRCYSVGSLAGHDGRVVVLADIHHSGGLNMEEERDNLLMLV
jgi:hypothetical protein